MTETRNEAGPETHGTSSSYQEAFCKNNCEHYELWKAGNRQHCFACKARAFHGYLEKAGYKIVRSSTLSMNEYQVMASKSMQPQCNNFKYLGLGLAGETGEFCDKLKRLIRGDGAPSDDLIEEGGDILWYLSQLFSLFLIDMEDAARRNLKKLDSRMDRGVISGKGDNR